MDVKVGQGIGKDGKVYEYLYTEIKINGKDRQVRLTCDFAIRDIVIDAIKTKSKV